MNMLPPRIVLIIIEIICIKNIFMKSLVPFMFTNT